MRIEDIAFWEESGKQEFELCKMLETRDNNMKEFFVSRDEALLNILHQYSESLRLMTREQINIRATLESIGKRQCELTKANGKILN